jgi:hypothetical protein
MCHSPPYRSLGYRSVEFGTSVQILLEARRNWPCGTSIGRHNRKPRPPPKLIIASREAETCIVHRESENLENDNEVLIADASVGYKLNSVLVDAARNRKLNSASMRSSRIGTHLLKAVIQPYGSYLRFYDSTL